MRCLDCHGQLPAEATFCECCGRKLTAQDVHSHDGRRTVGAEQLEFNFAEQAPWRCGSCGAPLSHGDLCEACAEAFSAVLGKATGTPAAVASAADSTAHSDGTFDASFASNTEAESAPAAPAVPEKAVDTVPVRKPPMDRPAVLAVGAVVIVSMIGVPIGARWVQNQLRAPIVETAPQQQPTRAPAREARESTRAQQAGAHSDPEEAPVSRESRASTPLPAPPARPQAVALPARPKTVAPPARAVRTLKAPGPGGRQSARPTETAAPAVTATPIPVTPAPVVPQPPSPPPVAAESHPAVTPEAPVGRLFEPNEVDEVPRIATRVEPQLPTDLPRSGTDVVVVRVLVSHTGHPFRVNLLRRSRLGPAVDDAVIAAVKRWTFSAARKRGEAVSCWYNFGVTVN